jgi:monoamine oxidase
VKRRRAIKQIGAGLSAGLLLPWISSCKDDEKKGESGYKGTVGIIGAGAAGLFAGDYLLENGINVEIYEASGRIGGRVRTLRPFDTVGGGMWYNQQTKISADFPVELGADRIYGDNSIWAKFISQQQYATLPLSGQENDFFWLNGSLLDFTTASAHADFANGLAFASNIGGNIGAAGTVQQGILATGVGSQMFPIMEGWIGNKNGTTNARLGLGAVAEAATLRQRNANDLLLHHNPMSDVLIGTFIRAAEKTMLNTVIRQIDYSGDKVVVNGERIVDGVPQQFTSTVDKLLVTVPISILKAGEISFTPSLPTTKTQALSKMDMDAAIRVVLDFRKNFWQEGFRNIFGGTEGIEYFNPGAGRSTVAKNLNVTISGAKAEELSALGIEIIPHLLEELDQIFAGQASENVRRDAIKDEYIAAIQDWSKEPFIKGGPSYLKPNGTNADREKLAAPVGANLFFAGEATDIAGEAGTVNGALQSGERAAKEIIESITG